MEDRIQQNAQLPGDERDANNVWMSKFKAPVTNCVPLAYRLKLSDVYCQVMMPLHYGAVTERLRAIEDVDRQKEFKLQKLDFVTPSGVFAYRNEEKLVHHSGLICIDIDQKENPEATRDLNGLKQHLLDDQELIHDLIHVSPRGNGLKDYVRIDIMNFSHQDNFKALRYYYLSKHGLVIDEACKDIVRACFLCYDPNAYVSPQICPF
ncbi:MAG: BT4734/BF3469 family protein [Prevotella sp.]